MTEPLDPSGIQVSVRVSTQEHTYNLWMRGAEGEDNASFWRAGADPYPDIPIVESVEMELNLGLNGKISIDIQATYDLGIQLLNSQLFTIGNTVEVQIGYPRMGRFTPWFAGMTAKPSIRFTPSDGLTGTLNIEGAGFAAIRGARARRYTGSYRQILETLASEHEWDIELPDTVAGDVLGASRVVEQNGRTDWAFIQMVTRSANCDASLEPSGDSGRWTLRVRRREDWFGRRPNFTFVARGQVDWVSVFPILTFDSQAEGVWLPQDSGRLRASDIRLDDRETVTEEVSATEGTRVPATGDTVVAEGATTVGGHRVVLRQEGTLGRILAIPSRDPRGVREGLVALSTESQIRGGISASISTFGMPDLFPGQLITLEGLGVFSGNYGIQSLSHRVAPGEWSTTMRLLSNALFGPLVITPLSEELTDDRVNRRTPDRQPDSSSGATEEIEPVLADEGPLGLD